MLEFFDYTTRRGALLPFIPKIYEMFKENAQKDSAAGYQMPEHIITWKQKINSQLVDINRRFLIAADGDNLAGLLFYRYEKTDIYIEDLQLSWIFRNNAQVLEGLLKKVEYDPLSKEAIFFASNRLKVDVDAELLKTKRDEWENLGSYREAANLLKIRYNRGFNV